MAGANVLTWPRPSIGQSGEWNCAIEIACAYQLIFTGEVLFRNILFFRPLESRVSTDLLTDHALHRDAGRACKVEEVATMCLIVH